jgi:hypothetical protein
VGQMLLHLSSSLFQNVSHDSTLSKDSLLTLKPVPIDESCLRRPDTHHRRDDLGHLPPAVFSQIPRSKGKLWH